MKLTEAEMRMVFQIESTNQNAALNEIYHCNGRANSTRPQSKRGSLRAMTHGQGQRYSRIERPQSIVRRTHQHGPGLDSRGAVPAAVRKPTFLF